MIYFVLTGNTKGQTRGNAGTQSRASEEMDRQTAEDSKSS